MARERGFANHPPGMFVGYAGMILVAISLFFLIRARGEMLEPSPAGVAAVAPVAAVPDVVAQSPAQSALFHLLLAMAAVILLGRLLGKLFAYVGQPPVIGEVLAGICLGPSLVGRVSPEVGAYLLPASVAPALGIVAQLGVILYMFVVGLELNAGILRKQGHVTLAISHASIIVPFSLGAALALWLYPLLAHGGVSFTAFALFLAVSMSVTAFPVLARILTDRNLQRSELGVIALACAATDDVSAWCLLALVVGVVQSNVTGALAVTALTVAYTALMFLVIRPLAARAIARYGSAGLTTGAMAVLLVGLLVSALATEAIGVHAIFGAFLFGAMIPHDSRLAREMATRLEDLVTTLLLPAFFALTGMRTEIGLVSGWNECLITAAIIAVATLGKFGGTLGAARVMGIPWREASSLGILMNTRGLMELIVLNIGLDLGVISPTLFSMLVLTAIVTTMATSPILSLLVREPAISRTRSDDPTPVSA